MSTPPTETAPDGRMDLRPMRFDGERRYALFLDRTVTATRARDEVTRARRAGAVLAYGFLEARTADGLAASGGFEDLGPEPRLVRPLDLGALAGRLPLLGSLVPARALPLFAWGGGRPRAGVREILVGDPRISRLWDRFSIDVGVAVERNAAHVNPRVFGSPANEDRVLVFEDGDRYVIRAMCVFRTSAGIGTVRELLHDRSVAGMRAASHLLGLAIRAMHEAGAGWAEAWSLPTSGSYPLYVRHGFTSTSGARLCVNVLAEDVARAARDRSAWYVSGLDLPDTVTS